MNIFNRKKENRDGQSEGQNESVTMSSPTLQKYIKPLTSEQAQKLGQVYRAVQLLSDQVAQLDVKIYRINNNEKQIAFDHPVFGLFRKPNARQTRYVYIKMIIEDILLHGNSYSFIKRDERGSPISLIHIPPQYVIPYYNPIEYEKPPLYQIAGSGKLIEHTDILHFINRTNDGILGLSTLRYAADTLGLARSANEHAANFFHQGQNQAGFLKVLGKPTDKQKLEIVQKWKNMMNGNGVGILEGNIEFIPTTINPDDYEVLQARGFDITQIATFFGVPQSKLNSKEGTTYNGLEYENLAFLTDTIGPLIQKMEAEMEAKLFNDYERLQYDIKFDVKNLLRVDLKSQSEYYRTMFNIGVYSINEIRNELDLNQIQNQDEHFVPANLVTIQQINQGSNLQVQQNKQNKIINDLSEYVHDQ